MFNGVFVFLLLLVPAYALSGALLVWIFRLPPFHAAMSLVAPALPWVAWLWPATISSSGWLKSLAWPVLVGTAFGMSLLGAQRVAAVASTQTDSARFGSCPSCSLLSRHPFIPTGLLSCGEDLPWVTPDNQAFSFSMDAMKLSASLMEALRSLIKASMFPSTVVNSLLSEAMACIQVMLQKQDMVFELGQNRVHLRLRAFHGLDQLRILGSRLRKLLLAFSDAATRWNIV